MFNINFVIIQFTIFFKRIILINRYKKINQLFLLLI